MITVVRKLKKKSLKDIKIRLKRILYQSSIKKKTKTIGLSYFYSDAFLSKFVKAGSVNELVDSFSFSDNKLFKNRTLIKENLKNLDEADKKRIIQYADNACSHVFNLLGSGDVEVRYGLQPKGLMGVKFEGKKKSLVKRNLLPKNYQLINWCIDFKSGFDWGNDIFYPKVREYGNKKGVDIKVPWELSRCQHFSMMGEAYLITGNEYYAEEIKHQIIDWINNNPYCYGPNWVCAMDVAIRAANWLVGLELIAESPCLLDRDFIKMLVISMLHHQQYIENNYEWASRYTSNHYLSDIVGQYFITTYMPIFHNSESTRKFCQLQLEKEIYKQTYKDGMNKEGSTSYHRLVLELFFYSALLGKENNSPFSKSFMERLSKMFQFVEYILKPNGTIPQIGDNDSGIFLKFDQRTLLDHAYLCTLSGVFFVNYYKDSGFVEKVLFNIKDHPPSILNHSNKSCSFDQSERPSGLFVYNDCDTYIAVYNGNNGQGGNGGHAHNDRLSFVLQHKGIDVFVDLGTGLYTPFHDFRNSFRSTSSHNTIKISGHEQNRFINGSIFTLSNDISHSKFRVNISEDGFVYDGSYVSSHSCLEVTHRRKLEYNRSKRELVVEDYIDKNDLKCEANFHIKCAKLPKEMIEFSGHHGLVTFPQKYSPAYGVIENNSVLSVSAEFTSHLRTVISLSELNI